MRATDASSIIHGWDNYPIAHFPSLRKWIGEQFASKQLTICEVAREEVRRRTPACSDWLRGIDLTVSPITEAMVLLALNIKLELGIEEDEFHAKGVGENDLLIIACAHEQGCELVTNEYRQNILPKQRSRYKIPAVCDIEMVAVPHLDFLELIVESGIVFEGL